MQEDTSLQHKADEVTIKELIGKGKEYLNECMDNWKIILLFVFPLVSYQIFQRYTKPAYYPATLKFMINETKTSSISGLLGQFSGLVGGEEDNMDKILELAKIRRTIRQSLLAQETIDGKNDYLANHLIRIENVHKIWDEDKQLKGFLFQNPNLNQLTPLENRAISELQQMLVGSESSKGLFTSSKNKKTGIMNFNLTTQNEQLSISLINSIYSSLSDFYIASTIRKEKESYDILSAKKDSIENLLKSNDFASAQHEDRSNSLLLNVDKVPAKRYSRNNQVLSALYAEVVKNTELAEFALKTATPYITLIEEPIPPILPLRKGKLTSIITFALLGLFLGGLFVIFRKILKDAST
jgi:hypothetical protein